MKRFKAKFEKDTAARYTLEKLTDSLQRSTNQIAENSAGLQHTVRHQQLLQIQFNTSTRWQHLQRGLQERRDLLHGLPNCFYTNQHLNSWKSITTLGTAEVRAFISTTKIRFDEFITLWRIQAQRNVKLQRVPLHGEWGQKYS